MSKVSTLEKCVLARDLSEKKKKNTGKKPAELWNILSSFYHKSEMIQGYERHLIQWSKVPIELHCMYIICGCLGNGSFHGDGIKMRHAIVIRVAVGPVGSLLGESLSW